MISRDWCEEHNRGNLPDGLCPECEERDATRRAFPKTTATIAKAKAELTEFPDCMMPDGAEPCEGYLRQFGENMDMRRRLDRIVAIIEFVENRCMAVDGPVTPTLQEMTQAELSQIYMLARGRDI